MAGRLGFIGDTSVHMDRLSAAVAKANAAGAMLDADALAARTEALFPEIREANAARAIDGPAETLVDIAAVTLASYRALMAALDGDETSAMSILYDTVVAPKRAEVKDWLETRMQISDDAPDQAFEQIDTHFKPGGDATYGKTMIYEQDVQDGERSFVNVRKCFFNDFFRGNDAPVVTTLFCALDNLWADEFERDSRYNVSFERPTRLALGDDCCRFQFSRRAPA